MVRKLRYAGILLVVWLASGCALAGNSIFPERMAYIQAVVDIESYLQGSTENIEANVLFNGLDEYLFILDQPPSGEARLLVFDTDLELLYQGTASGEGVAFGEYGRLMMVSAGFNFVVGNIVITPDFNSFTPTSHLLDGDSRYGFSNFSDTNWILDVYDDGVHFRLTINEYADLSAPATANEDYLLYPYDPSLSVSVENALYLEDEQQVILAIHSAPSNELFLFEIPTSDFPGGMTPLITLVEDGTYLEAVIEDVQRGSVDFTVNGLLYYDVEQERVRRSFADQSGFPVETDGDGKPIFAFSLLGQGYYYIDPGRGELYKMDTWW